MKSTTYILIKFIVLTALVYPFCVKANGNYDKGNFLTIKANEANVRTGPSIKYPIRWQYIKKNWPVKIIEEFSNWRKFEDIDGEAGWIHISLLSKRRSIIFNKENTNLIYKKPTKNSRIILKAEKKVLASLIECNYDNWCLIKLNNKKGWIQSNYLWGI